MHSDRPVDALTVAVLHVVDPVAHELRIPYFVAGATARDILLTHVCGIPAGVATRDIDFAVAVRDWPQFEALKARLLQTGHFNTGSQAHRLFYQSDSGRRGYPLDIIPFRGAEAPGNKLIWPPAFAEEMNVIGYEEVLRASVEVQLDPALTVYVASLPGLALLKFFAWDDRGAETRKDARDLMFLLRHYASVEEARLFGADFDALEAVDHDFHRAGARLLGRDVRLIASPDTLKQLLALLDEPKRADRLATHMVAMVVDHEYSEDAEVLLQEFHLGLLGK